LAADGADTGCAGRTAATGQNRIELAQDQAGTRRRGISCPGRNRHECREPESHPTLHGVVFDILCLDRASARARERVQARRPSSAPPGPLPDRLAASSPPPAPEDIL